MTTRIVVDENIPLVHEFFSTLGEVVAVAPREIAPKHLKDAQLLIVRSVAPITEALLQDSAVQFVGTCTAGTDHLAVDYLQARGIHWTGAPGCNANAVVEYVFSVLSYLNVPWQTRTVGIIGCGHVGGLLHRRLRALGVTCRCYDPFLDRQQNSDLCSLAEILQSAIVCIHAPLTINGLYPTRHMLGAQQLQQLTEEAVLINAGRGPVIDGEALLALLEKRRDVTVALDVWEHEPAIARELFEHVNLGTPHIAGHSYDGKIIGTETIYQRACAFLGTKPALSLAEFDQQPLQYHVVDADNRSDNLKQAILCAYNAGDDNRRFATQLEHDKNTALVFDEFRKHYPKRREFHKHLIELANRDPQTARDLELLGFQVAS